MARAYVTEVARAAKCAPWRPGSSSSRTCQCGAAGSLSAPRGNCTCRPCQPTAMRRTNRAPQATYTAHWVKSSRFAWLVAGCMGPARATALHGQQVLECPWRASRLCAKNSVRPDRHVWGAYQSFWHSAPVSLDCRAVTQGQRAGNTGSANCRSRHPTRTRSGRASWSPRLLHRRALGKTRKIACQDAQSAGTVRLTRVLDRAKSWKYTFC